MKKQKEIDWIFFDVGGVLMNDTESEEWRKKMVFKILHEYNSSLTRVAIDDAFQKGSGFVGNTDDNIIKVLVKDKKEAERLVALARKSRLERWPTMHDFANRSPFTTGVLETLQKLSKVYNLGIIANQPHETTERFKKENLLKYFKIYSISANKGFHKPDIRLFQEVLKETGADPKRSVMIDDNIERGIIPAKSLGFKTVWFDWGVRKNAPVYMDYTIKKFSDLLDIF